MVKLSQVMQEAKQEDDYLRLAKLGVEIFAREGEDAILVNCEDCGMLFSRRFRENDVLNEAGEPVDACTTTCRHCTLHARPLLDP